MQQVDLSRYNNSAFKRGAGTIKQALWYYTSLLFFRSGWLPVYGFKRMLLRAFGARVGPAVIIKPHVRIKFPWKLQIGAYSWIGEYAWIDNLAPVNIGAHCVLSQGCLLLTGNHDYKRADFALITQPITLEDGCWIGAKAAVAPGVSCGNHAVLSMQSVAVQNLAPFAIYQGNPARKVRMRKIKGDN